MSLTRETPFSLNPPRGIGRWSNSSDLGPNPRKYQGLILEVALAVKIEMLTASAERLRGERRDLEGRGVRIGFARRVLSEFRLGERRSGEVAPGYLINIDKPAGVAYLTTLFQSFGTWLSQ
jgi:hypothetical protein